MEKLFDWEEMLTLLFFAVGFSVVGVYVVYAFAQRVYQDDMKPWIAVAMLAFIALPVMLPWMGMIDHVTGGNYFWWVYVTIYLVMLVMLGAFVWRDDRNLVKDTNSGIAQSAQKGEEG